MFTDYNFAIESLNDELNVLNKALAKWKGIDHYTRHRVYELGIDIVTFSEYFLDAHINAIAWITDATNEAKHSFQSLNKTSSESIERMAKRSKSISGKLEKQSTKKLEVTYKSLFFFIRAFHDAGYAALLNLSDQTPGNYSSMKDCLKKKSTCVYNWVSDIDGYEDWFHDFKKKRDSIKKGAKFNIAGPQWDVGISFAIITKEGGVSSGSEQYKISNLIEALNKSVDLAKLISSKAKT